MNYDFLRREQRLAISLKALYKNYGYGEYKLSSFEEYSLYADNKSFLGGQDVISFSVGGKLLALRPDVTLSVIKNVRPDGGTQKLFYDEKVYRKTARGGGFSEVSQIGVEVIGDIDLASEAELCTLIMKTLAMVGGGFVLDLSHMGIIVKTLEILGLSGEDGKRALEYLKSKNVHDFGRFAAANGIDEKRIQAFETLITIPAEPDAAIKKLYEINRFADISAEIAELKALIGFVGGGNVNIDFSIGGDLDYYNGLIFKGYVKGVPHAVLSGGRYDKLLEKFDKSAKALGFALYLGELGKYFNDAPDMPDSVLIYDESNALEALRKAEKLRANGEKVLLSRRPPEGFKGRIYRAEDVND